MKILEDDLAAKDEELLLSQNQLRDSQIECASMREQMLYYKHEVELSRSQNDSVSTQQGAPQLKPSDSLLHRKDDISDYSKCT
jgi:hypothetical protein